MRPRTLWDRELGLKTNLRSEDLVDEECIEKLDLYKTLVGHEGCVNTLKWNQSGSLLASGSDDTYVKLWNVEGDCIFSQKTSHTGNIFGVVFVPGTDSIMTCAGDMNVIMTNLESKEETRWTTRGRVKRLASSSYYPNVCWSISEDRFVRMHDTRISDSDVKFKIGYSGKSIDISEIQPHWLAIASESTCAEIHDTRMMRLAKPVMSLGPLDMKAQDPYYITHVAFAKKSNTLLANYGRGSTYLFDLNDSSRDSFFCQQLDKMHQLDTSPCSTDPPLSTSIQNAVQRVQSLVSEFHYVDALAVLSSMLKRQDLTATERAQLLLKRSTTFIARKREGDSYAAAKDTVAASILLPTDPQPLLRLINVLQKMEQMDICQEMIDIFKTRFPDHVDELRDVEESVASLLAVPNRRTRNLRRNGALKRDYSSRYSGHMNENTDIKEAAFFGPNEQFIMAGSDSGHIFVYNRNDSSIVTLLKGDSSIVNCIQPHPHMPMVAASGLDNDFLLFSTFNSSSMPHPPSDSNRIAFADAEPLLARLHTRNIFRELVLINRFGGVEGEEQCQVS